MSWESGTFSFSNTLNVSRQQPLDARQVAKNLGNLTSTEIPAKFKGMMVSVTNDEDRSGGNANNNGLYILTGTDSTQLSSWTKVGDNSSFTATSSDELQNKIINGNNNNTLSNIPYSSLTGAPQNPILSSDANLNKINNIEFTDNEAIYGRVFNNLKIISQANGALEGIVFCNQDQRNNNGVVGTLNNYMKICRDGQVLIGSSLVNSTNNPTYKLNVDGDTNIIGNLTGTGNINIGSNQINSGVIISDDTISCINQLTAGSIVNQGSLTTQAISVKGSGGVEYIIPNTSGNQHEVLKYTSAGSNLAWGKIDNNSIASSAGISSSKIDFTSNDIAVNEGVLGQCVFNHAAIGTLNDSGSTIAMFSNKDQKTSSTGYAIRQTSTGLTEVNSTTGNPVVIKVGNAERAKFHADGKITGTGIKTALTSSTNVNQLITASGIRTYVQSEAVTFTNKSFDCDGTGNSLTNISNGNIKSGAAIDATKIANGSISNTEFQQLNGINTSQSIETRLAALEAAPQVIACCLYDGVNDSFDFNNGFDTTTTIKQSTGIYTFTLVNTYSGGFVVTAMPVEPNNSKDDVIVHAGVSPYTSKTFSLFVYEQDNGATAGVHTDRIINIIVAK